MKVQEYIIISLLLFSVTACKDRKQVLHGDPGNGGLFLPDQFEALVVADGVLAQRCH